jgi:hypothetical protein
MEDRSDGVRRPIPRPPSSVDYHRQSVGTPVFRRKQPLSILLILGAIVATLLLTGCSAQTDRIWLNAPDWSRAQYIGDTASGDRPVFALAPDNSATFLLVVNQNGRYHPKAVHLDGSGVKRWEQEYPEINMARPDMARAYWADDAIHAFWLSNESLYHARLNPANGQMDGPPDKLSGDIRVGDYAVAVDQSGKMVVWFSGPRIKPGLYRLENNDLAGKPVLIDETGIRPTLAFDGNGALHALWARYPMGQPDVTVLYATDALNGPAESDTHVVATPKAAMGSVFSGPIMGLAGDTAYVFWSIEIRTGVAAGAVDARYLTFPVDNPAATSKPTQMYAPSDYHLPYEDWLDEGFRAGKRSGLVSPRTGKITQLYAHSSDLPELVTIQRELVQFTMRDTAYQIGTLFFNDGQPDSYQLLSFTGGDSRSPYITSDADRWLYASWMERGEIDGFRIMYASTNPVIVKSYAQLSGEDYQTLAARTGFGIISSALLFPFILMWMIAPIVLYLITFPLRRNNEGEMSTGVIISLLISIVGYWIAKFGFLGGITSYVPFSAWIPVIPDRLALPLQIGIPALILGVSLGVAWLFTYKRQNPSSLLFLVLYLAVDGLLSAAIYGPLILATN